jgi:hypothetical protein
MANCRSCNAAILWARTSAKGKFIPIDPDPVDDGNIELSKDDEGQLLARVLIGSEGTLPGFETPLRYKSHFATCPHANSHRRRSEPS